MRRITRITFLSTITLLVFMTSGCLLLLLGLDWEGTVSSTPAKASSDNYIYVTSSTLELDKSYAGKTAYLVKVNYGKTAAAYSETGSFNSENRSLLIEETNISAKKTASDSEENATSANKYNFRCGYFGEVPEPGEEVDRAARTTITVNDDYSLGDTKQFYVASNSKDTYTYEKATLKAIGKHCFVWYIEPFSTETKAFIFSSQMKFTELQEVFDSAYETETKIFGSTQSTHTYSNVMDTTPDQKVHIVIYDLYGDADIGTTDSGTLGFFRPTDLFINGEKSGTKTITTSNQRQLLNLDSYIFQCHPEIMYSTAVHEFQHLLSNINKDLNNNVNLSTWYQEMMSMAAEEIFQHEIGISDEASPKSRLRYFNSCYHFGFGEQTWDFAESKKIGGTFDYANTYAFATYLMHNYGGIDLINKIATNSYEDEYAITKALEAMGYDEDFTTVLCKFGQIIANLSSDSSKFKTLNRTVGANSKYNSIALDKILLSDWNATESGYYNTFWKNNLISKISDTYNKSSPYIYKSSTQRDLYSYGMSVHYLGTVAENGATLSFNLPSNGNIAMFVMLK